MDALHLENGIEQYGDEVLNAGWLPQPDECPEGVASATGSHLQCDPDDFLRGVYSYQE